MSLDNVKNILLILSGKGGVGKSSITTQLALSLSLAGKSVGILDIDLTGPSIPRLLGIEASKITQAPGGWLPVEVHAAQTLKDAPKITYPLPSTSEENGTEAGSTPAPTSEQDAPSTAAPASTTSTDPSSPSQRVGPLHAMSLAFLLSSRSSAIVWRGPKKTAMVRQFLTDVLWPELDYLLIDTPPGTSDEHISVVETLLKNVATASLSTGSVTQGPNLAGAVIVTTPQAVAVADVRKEINFCAKTGVRIVGVVENMSGFVCPCCGVEAKLFSKGGGKVMAGEFKVPFLGYVPVDGLWGRLVEEGIRPVYGDVERKGGGGDGLDQGVEQLDIETDSETDDDWEDEVDGEEDGVPKEREPGLLVDKYRNCSLSPVFAAISGKVLDIVESDKAVTLSKNVVHG